MTTLHVSYGGGSQVGAHGPMRQIVKTYEVKPRAPGQPKWVLDLECGHREVRNLLRDPNNQIACRSCAAVHRGRS